MKKSNGPSVPTESLLDAIRRIFVSHFGTFLLDFHCLTLPYLHGVRDRGYYIQWAITIFDRKCNFTSGRIWVKLKRLSIPAESLLNPCSVLPNKKGNIGWQSFTICEASWHHLRPFIIVDSLKYWSKMMAQKIQKCAFLPYLTLLGNFLLYQFTSFIRNKYLD